MITDHYVVFMAQWNKPNQLEQETNRLALSVIVTRLWNIANIAKTLSTCRCYRCRLFVLICFLLLFYWLLIDCSPRDLRHGLYLTMLLCCNNHLYVPQSVPMRASYSLHLHKKWPEYEHSITPGKGQIEHSRAILGSSEHSKQPDPRLWQDFVTWLSCVSLSLSLSLSMS